MRTAWLCAAFAFGACRHSTCQDHAVPPVPVTEDDMKPHTLSLDDYEATVYGAGPNTTFAPTTVSEHQAIAQLVPKLLDGAWSARPPSPFAWQQEANAAGFRIQVWTIDGGAYWALLEAPGRARGAGAYIFRVAPREASGPTILLEAPHNFYDLGTGRLAAELFFSGKPGIRPRALFTNTIHRYQLAPGDKRKRKHNPADVAHNPEHAFTYATEAFAIAAGGARVIQLHGFGARVDDDDEPGEVGSIAAVISSGDAGGSSPLSTAVANGLAALFGNEVKRFPEDVKLLGATTNVQGRLLRNIPSSEFVHVEISRELRKRLAASAELRGKLAGILYDTSPDPTR